MVVEGTGSMGVNGNSVVQGTAMVTGKCSGCSAMAQAETGRNSNGAGGDSGHG